MTKQEIQEQINLYTRYDNGARAAQKRKDFKRAAELKKLRDQINITELLRARVEKE